MRELGCNDKGNGLLQEKLAITSSSTAKLTRSFTAASSLSLAVRVELCVLSFACAGGHWRNTVEPCREDPGSSGHCRAAAPRSSWGSALRADLERGARHRSRRRFGVILGECPWA